MTVLRVIAILVALGGVLDPSLSLSRAVPTPVRLHVDRSDPDAADVEARLRAAMDDRLEFVAEGDADAHVVVGTTRLDAAAFSKPLSLGLPAMMLPARIAPLTCEPSDEPIDRTSALNPVASPVSAGETASTMRFGIAEKARPMPVNRTVAKIATSACVPCTSPSSARPSAAMTPPRPSGTLLP